VNARRRDERGKLGQQLVGRERQPGRAVPRPLHPVEQPAIVAAGEAVQRERRAQDVAAQALAPVPIVGVDPDARVQRKAVEKGATPGLLERLGVALAPLHLGGLQRGESVGLRVQIFIEADDDLRRPPDDAGEDGRDVLVVWLRYREEARWAVTRGDEHSVGDQGMEVDVEVEGAAEALDGSDAAGPRLGRPQPPRGPPLPGEDGAGEHVEQTRGEGRVTGGEEADPPRQREDPLPHRRRRQHVPDQVVGPVLHASGGAGGAHVRLARERDQPLETAVGTADPGEAASQDAAVEVGAQLALDEGRQTAPMLAALAGAGEERFELVAYNLVQDGLLRLAPRVVGERRAGIAGVAFPDFRSVP